MAESESLVNIRKKNASVAMIIFCSFFPLFLVAICYSGDKVWPEETLIMTAKLEQNIWCAKL
jgi:hypothetical protein